MATSDNAILGMIGNVGEGAPGMDEKLMLMNQFRALAPRKAEMLDRYMLDRLHNLGGTVTELHATLGELTGSLDELKREALAPPWHPAVFLGHVDTCEGVRAVVGCGSSRRVVAVAQHVDLTPRDVGKEVFLGHEMNVVLDVSPLGLPPVGELAFFARAIDDARLVARYRDEEVVLRRAGSLLDEALEPGDSLRWDSKNWLAYERLERKEHQSLFLKEAPAVERHQIGGMNAILDRIRFLILGRYEKPSVAAKYGVETGDSLLFWGPPGCGKTTTARFVASECTRTLGRPFKFAHIQPSDYLSKYVGETEQNIRRLIDMLRREKDWVVFFDDCESMGRIRGDSFNKWRDDVTDCWLKGFDGFDGPLPGFFIFATNRKDMLDSAMLQRMSTGGQIFMPPPDMEAGRAIFGVHMPESCPYAANGQGQTAAREDVIDLAVSRMYSPNGDNTICKARFADGRTRTIHARELSSGRVFAQICRSARHSACRREMETDATGITAEDIENAVAEALDQLRTTVTAHNIRSYVPDLPQDVQIVSVEPVVPRVVRPRQYLNVA